MHAMPTTDMHAVPYNQHKLKGLAVLVTVWQSVKADVLSIISATRSMHAGFVLPLGMQRFQL